MKVIPFWLRSRASLSLPRRWCVCAGIALVGLLPAALAGCSKEADAASAPPSARATEQRWVIVSIIRDCTNMATFAAAPEHWIEIPTDAVTVRATTDSPQGEDDVVSILLPGSDEPVKSDLKITRSVWSPELYAPALDALFARLKVPVSAGQDSSGAMPEPELIKALSNPVTPVIEDQNQRLSTWLQGHPWDARAHEQAAFLLGTLAMRENSGPFWNPRGLCNRAAAHLAFARAVRKEVSVSGEIAELLIGLMLDTKADCQKRIAALRTRAATLPDLGPWVTAASLRNTRDYRVLSNPRDATFLERLEQFRAMSEAISAEEAIKRVENRQPDTAPDWSHMVLQGGYGVGSGHQFALPSVGLEIKDAVQIFPGLRTARAPAQFAAILNLPPGDIVQPDENHQPRFHVIDQGTWAQYFERHLLQAANETYNFLQNRWGVPDDAQRFRAQVGPLVKPLTLYPLCLDFLGNEDGEALYPQAASLLNQHPEWVGDGAWALVVKTVPARYATGGSWPSVSSAWFSPRVPVGTVYGFSWRTDEEEHVLPPPGLPELQNAYNIASLKYDVARLYLNAVIPNHHPTVEQYKQVLGPLPSYYLPAMWSEAYLVQNDPAKYGAIMGQAATLDPTYYFYLGKYYLDHKMEPQAAQAYQGAIDHDADSVMVSNNCSWLVNYYYDHGQRDKALTIAQQAAEIYSSKGLETLASLLERMGRVQEAESYYAKIKERYDDAGLLHAFYTREATGHPEYAQKMKAAERELFPQGIEEITLAQLSGKPTNGVLVRGENELSRQCGLKPGAIVVGIDGKRVRSMDQYTYVRALTDSPVMDLLVYQEGKYQELRARVPGRLFNLDFTSWP